MCSSDLSSLLSDVVVSFHCAMLAASDALATEAKAHSEYGMEQEENSQIPRSMQNQNQTKTKLGCIFVWSSGTIA